MQIHKIRNIAAPKSNEDSQVAPRMLKLTLTDGYSFCQGIECESIPELNVDRVPPGSKVLLKNANIRSGYILLNPSCCIYLGGKVPTLYEKWEVSRSLLKTTRKRSCKCQFGLQMCKIINWFVKNNDLFRSFTGILTYLSIYIRAEKQKWIYKNITFECYISTKGLLNQL